MGCQYFKYFPCITDYEMAEIEKLGQKYWSSDTGDCQRSKIWKITQKVINVDDCLLQRVTQHTCYMVGAANEPLHEDSRSLKFLSWTFVTTNTALSGCQMTGELLGSNFFEIKSPCLPSTNFLSRQFPKHAASGTVALVTYLLCYELNMTKYTHFLCWFEKGKSHLDIVYEDFVP